MQVVASREGTEQALDSELYSTGREATTSQAQEHRPSLRGSRRLRQLRVAVAEVAAQRLRSVPAQRYDPLLLPFAADFHLVGHKVEVGLVQSRQLGEPYPRGIEQL